jgi:hypothetical protein
MTRVYLTADLVHTALSHLLMFHLEGYLFSPWKYYLPFYLVHYAAFVYRGTFLHHRHQLN